MLFRPLAFDVAPRYSSIVGYFLLLVFAALVWWERVLRQCTLESSYLRLACELVTVFELFFYLTCPVLLHPSRGDILPDNIPPLPPTTAAES